MPLFPLSLLMPNSRWAKASIQEDSRTTPLKNMCNTLLTSINSEDILNRSMFLRCKNNNQLFNLNSKSDQKNIIVLSTKTSNLGPRNPLVRRCQSLNSKQINVPYKHLTITNAVNFIIHLKINEEKAKTTYPSCANTQRLTTVPTERLAT
jgi:hypothetical protein